MFKMEKNYKMVFAFTKKNHAAVRSTLIKLGNPATTPELCPGVQRHARQLKGMQGSADRIFLKQNSNISAEESQGGEQAVITLLVCN